MTQDNRAALFAFLADNHIPAIGLMEDSPDPEGIPYDGTIQRAQMATGFELRPSIEGIIASYSAGPTGNETLC
ncbi:hypothetical protein M1555_01955 [Patescibacteria group bacterium]|nr:hypothetical protein [Patescibacteria group bacterium]